MKIKKYDSVNGWVQQYPEVNVGAIVTSNDIDSLTGSTDEYFLRADGSWAKVETSGNQFVNISGDTMTGNLTTTSGNNNGIYIGSGGANITSVTPSSKDVVIQDVAQIRFGSASWDWNSWAGLAFNASTEVLTIGGPASSVFSSNTNPPSIDVNFDGLNSSGLKVNNNTVWHAGNDDNLTKKYTWQPGIVYWHNGGTDAGFRNILKVTSSSLSTGGILYVDGTSGSVVVNARFEILVNHYQDIVVKSLSGGYTQVKIKVQTGNNEDFNILIARNRNDTNTTTITATFIPYDQNATVTTYTNNPAVSYSSVTLTHTTIAFSENISATGGSTGKLYVEGSQVWHAGNDGASSGLDADTLDTKHASDFVAVTGDTMTGSLAFTNTTDIGVQNASGNSWYRPEDQYGNTHIEVRSGKGIYVDADTIAFRSQANTDRMRINSSGNVGIGTTSPASKFEIYGAATDDVGLASILNTHSGGGIFYPTLRAVNKYSNHSYGTVAEFRTEDGSGTDRPSIMFSSNHSGHTWTAGQGGYTATDNFAITHRSSHPTDTSAWGTARLVIDTSGKVGIGTTSPSAKLDINGRLNLDTDVIRFRTISSSSWDTTLQGTSLGKIEWYTEDGSGNGPMQLARIDLVNNAINQYLPVGELAFFTAPYNDASPNERMRITGDGNVGIGTTSPIHKLQVGEIGTTTTLGTMAVSSDANGYAILIEEPSQGAESWGIGVDTAGDLNFYDSGSLTPSVVFNDGGNVGIGTTTPPAPLSVRTTTDNDYALHIRGTIHNVSGDWTGIGISGEDLNTKGAILYESLGSSYSRGKLHFALNNELNQNSATPNDAIMTLLPSGEVGIGTTSPSNKLQVVGNARVEGNLMVGDAASTNTPAQPIHIKGAGEQALRIEDTNSSNQVFDITVDKVAGFKIKDITNSLTPFSISNTGDVTITGDLNVSGSFTTIDTDTTTTEQWSVTNDGTGPAVIINQKGSQPVIDIQDDGTSVFHIEDGGNVGIGTTNPTRKLHINSGTNDIGLLVESLDQFAKIGLKDNTTTSDAQVLIAAVGNDMFLEAGGSEKVRIKSGGNVGIGTTSPEEKLDVSGSILVPNASQYKTELADGTNRVLMGANGDDTVTIGDGAAGYTALRFFPGGSEAMRIQTNGNVGIGTTSPGEKLEVNGKIKVNNEIIATKLVDYNNGNYYVDPASTSVLNVVDANRIISENVTTTPDKIGNIKIARLHGTTTAISNINNLDTFILSKTDGGYGSGTKPSGTHNGFGVISLQTHDGNYYTQLGLDTNQNALWIRSANGTTSYGSWQRAFADNYHPNADKWTTARTITLGGDLTGNVSIDGSANVTLSAQVTALDDKAEVTYTSGGTTSDVSTLNFSLSGSTLTITTS